MKKSKMICCMMVVLMMMLMFAGCAKKEKETDQKIDTDPNAGSVKNEVTVTFYDADGTTVLNTETIESGSLVKDYTPLKDGYEFVGWFATPQMSHAFDFTTAITKDTKVFGGFVKYQADTREYAVVGSGKSPLLITSSWGEVINSEHKLTKSADKNEYTITLDLLEGDEFQFVINTSWENQRGYGYLTTINQDGVEYFVNSGAYGDSTVKRSNIKVGVTGNYTFVLTTHPAEDTYESDNANYTEESKEKFNVNPYDTITWTYNGDVKEAAIDIIMNYYIKGSGITNWKDVYTDKTGMKEENGVHTLVIALKQGEEFLFTSMVTANGATTVGSEYLRFSNLDEKSQALFDKTDSYNMVAKENGLYTLTYDPVTKLLSATCDTSQFLPKYDYFMKGSFNNTSWGTEGNPDYQLVETEEGSNLYVLKEFTVVAGDEFGMQSMNGSERVLFYNYNYLTAAEETNANADFESNGAANANTIAKSSNTYTVTFNAYTEEITFTPSK